MSKMGQKFVDEQEQKLEQLYNEAVYMAVNGRDIEWAMECALNATGALDHEPTDAYFNRVKRYAIEILRTKKELADEVNGSIY